MAAPTPSDLDFSQCIQGSYDEPNGRLRVDAAITAPLDVNGEVLVDIRATDGDSVLVYGTTNGQPTGTTQVLKVNPDGSININTDSPTAKTVNSLFGSISSVGNGILTTILSYTVPVSKLDYLSLIEVSGSNMAQFEVYINGTLSARRRTSLTEYNSQFNFLVDSEIGLSLISGTLLQIMVIQNRPDLGDYEARIVYAE